MWTSPAFYIAVVSLMANVGNYLHTLTVRSTARKVQAAVAAQKTSAKLVP